VWPPRYFRFSARAHITSVLQVCFTPRSGSHVISERSPAQGHKLQLERQSMVSLKFVKSLVLEP
jgi:hypothetical protein